VKEFGVVKSIFSNTKKLNSNKKSKKVTKTDWGTKENKAKQKN